MKKMIIIISVCVAAILIGILVSDPVDELASMHLKDNVIYYDGSINAKSHEKLVQILDVNPNVDHVVIKSQGGETRAGIAIGTTIYERGLDVTVDTLCFSSCANYVFTAGDSKYIKENGIVGWHGSEAQYEIMAAKEGISVEELLKRDISKGLDESVSFWHTDEDIQKYYDEFVAGMGMEKEFFAMIGVDENSTVSNLAILDGGCVGWTYTIEAMKGYGIDNVTYQSEKEYPDRDALSGYEICLI